MAPEKFYELALKYNDLLPDFFAEATRNRDSNTWATARNPNDFPNCDYHYHEKDVECPYHVKEK